jgi:hypothetical protein
MGEIVLFALLSAVYPTLIAAPGSWCSERGRHYAVSGLAIVAGLLVIVGVVGLAT